MPAVDPVILQLRADVAKYRNELRSTTTLVDQSLARQEAAARRLEVTMGRAFDGAGNALKGFISSIGGTVIVRQFLAMADASKSIDAQLRLATQSFGTFAQAQQDAQRIARETRNGLTETASLYGNLIRATQSLGGSQEQAARATETFSKALKIGGADTNAAASATLQFGQALASGALRGDEFNSIAEASPRILQLLADAIGVPRGELRKLAEDGKLTSDVLFRALTDRKFTAGIDAEFKTLPVTFSEAMQSVENAATITIGAFDRGGQFSTMLANFITDGSGGFDKLSDKAEEFGADTRSVIAGLANVFDPLEVNGSAVFDALGVKIYSVSEQIRSLLGSIDAVRNFYADADNLGTRFENGLKRAANRAIDRAGGGQKFVETPLIGRSNLAGNFAAGQRRDQARSRLDRAVRRLEGQGYIVPRRADGMVDESGIRRKPAAAPPPRSSSGGGKSGSRSRARTGTAIDEAAEAAKLVASIRQDMGALNSDLGRLILNETERLELAARSFSEVFGEQPDYIGGIVDDYERETRLATEDRYETERDLQDLRRDNIRSLADFYEDAFLSGTGGIFENFKRTGLRVIAELLAQWTAGQAAKGGIGGGIASFLGSFASIGMGGGIPRFASGGSMMLGGSGGVDRNVLSLNGAPIARVSRGEAMTISPNARAMRPGGGTTILQTVSVDARGAVMNDQFASLILARAGQQAQQLVGANNTVIRKGLPAAQAKFGQLGTT